MRKSGTPIMASLLWRSITLSSCLSVLASAPVLHPLAATSPRASLMLAKDQARFVGQFTSPTGVTTVPIQIIQNGAILVPAAVDGHQGMFLFDTGSPVLLLNGEYVKSAATGGLDTNTDLPTDTSFAKGGVVTRMWTGDSVLVRIGTLTISVTKESAHSAVRDLPYVAFAAPIHAWSVAWGGHVLGILGLPVLANYETIIDYTRRQLTLIPVDSVGRRLVVVPQYSPRTTTPMFYGTQAHWYVETHLGGLLDTLLLDTGNDLNELNLNTKSRLASHVNLTGQLSHLQDGTREPGVMLDSLIFGGHRWTAVPFYVSQREDCLGGEFFRQVKIVGFNFRAQQVLIYQ